MIKRALTDEDWALITKYALGGLGIGGAAALATNLIDYIKNMNRLHSSDPSDADDSTLYIKVKNPTEKKASDDSVDRNVMFSGPAAITAGALSALGGWALVNAIYKKMMLAEAQKELDEAQNQFIDLNGYERVKSASDHVRAKSMGGLTNLLSLLFSVPGLFSIASGVIAYNALDKYFPEKKKQVTSPRRIKIVSEDTTAGDSVGPDYNTNGTSDQYSAPALDKVAGVTESDGVEFMIRSIVTSGMRNSDIANMVGDVAQSGSNSFEKLATTIGFENAISATKGRASNNLDPLTEQLAITHLAKSASVGPQVAITAAAEFAETFPTIYMTAASLSDEQKDFFEKIARVMGRAARTVIVANELNLSDEVIEKQASMIADDNTVLSVLDKLNSLNSTESNEDSEDRTETSKEEAGIKNKPKYVASSKTGLRLAKAIEEMDDIDKILNPESNRH